MAIFFQRYLLPGLIFQGVVIGGGYATGREIAEFFLPHGPIGGLFSMGVAALVWSCVLAVSFELSRMTRSYDYKTFFHQLLGRFWFLFEILLILLMIVVLSVIGAAAGEIAQNLFNAPALTGTLALLLAIGMLTFYGSHLIEQFMGSWSILLYIAYFTLVVWSLFVFGDNIRHNFSQASIGSGWILDGIRYAGYNLAVVPMVLFCIIHLDRRRDAITAGLLAGLIGMLPAVFLFIAMMGQYPQIGEAPIPSTALLMRLGSPWFSIVFQLVLLGTLVQTGVGLIHGVNERIASTLREAGRTMPGLARTAVATGMLLVALVLAAQFGLISLIARGYGLLTFGFIAVFVIPVLTVGVYKIINNINATPEVSKQ
ncbi:MAG: hypothetical protein HOC23_21940 [Halieaceae bacterium]|jgi:uncharacterized membrane protein YkvI|nr:hypothetical protein [Halieaceae bacterium]